MKIYVDTSWFLSFYQSNHERRHVLEAVGGKSHLLVMTEQNITEFRRNRAALLRQLREQVTKSTRAQPYTTSLLLGLDEHRRVIALSQALKDAGDALAMRIDALETSLEQPDQVLLTFNEVLTKCTVVNVTDEDVVRAQRRKARGIPPSSGKRETIGDEVIWESLLRGCEEDLAIVSLDSDFLRQRDLLAEEFEAHKSHRNLVYVGDKLSDALDKFGALTPEMYKAEYGQDPWTRCANCGGNGWHYAGQDHNYEHELQLSRAAGNEAPDRATLGGPGYENAVYVCGTCRAIMLVT